MSLSPGRRLVALAIAVVAVVLLLVVALVPNGSGDEITIVRGAPDRGFPLRGDLAGDETKIRAAVDAWARRERRDGGTFAGDGDDGVTVLWAGRTEPGTDTIVLAAEFDAVILTRSDAGDDDYWQPSDATIGSAEDPVVVAGEDGVLTREGAPNAFRRAGPEGRGGRPLRNTAGFWHRGGSSLPDGTVLLPRGLQTRSDPRPEEPAAVFTGEGAAVRVLSPELLRRLDSGPEARRGPDALRLVAAARAAGTAERDGRDQRGAGDRYTPQDAPELDLVADRRLDPVGPVLVLGVQDRGRDRRSLVAASGDRAIANGDEPTGFRVGASEPESGLQATAGLRARTGPAFGAAYVRVPAAGEDDDDGSSAGGSGSGGGGGGSATAGSEDAMYLLVAGDDEVARIEVLAGRRTVRRDGPVAVVPAPWTRGDPRDRDLRGADVAILGRTAGGALVVPPPVTVHPPPAG